MRGSAATSSSFSTAGLTEIAAHLDKFTAAGADVLAGPKNAPLRCSNICLVRAGGGIEPRAISLGI